MSPFINSYRNKNIVITQQVIAFIVGVANGSVIPVSGRIEHDVIPGIASEALVQGPSTKTRLLGADGSEIAADAPGGRILPNQVPVVAVPLVETQAILADPVVAVPAAVLSQPVVAVARSLEPAIVAAPIANTVVEEVVTETIVSSDNSGDYIPDNNEKLFDDGSYKESATEETTEDGSYKGE
ncbi:hypothetical protein MML48_3g00019183 [Holotrichia oblita]|uniref:Uncharacterized protein n=2 Tax=Holotrichia oblita TaxID=644536 RepID=A0ACB9TDI6_HOLOL|nr:hypothetical protein MML48_3g00002387 [Holotrichia oblita]KAI4464855.1 hypothetical protein MML48_3g00019183 [Holotrichia oblita]